MRSRADTHPNGAVTFNAARSRARSRCGIRAACSKRCVIQQRDAGFKAEGHRLLRSNFLWDASEPP
jgi:hypothetical protein